MPKLFVVYLLGLLVSFVAVFVVMTIGSVAEYKVLKERDNRAWFVWRRIDLPDQKILGLIAYWGLELLGNLVMAIGTGILWPFILCLLLIVFV